MMPDTNLDLLKHPPASHTLPADPERTFAAARRDAERERRLNLIAIMGRMLSRFPRRTDNMMVR